MFKTNFLEKLLCRHQWTTFRKSVVEETVAVAPDIPELSSGFCYAREVPVQFYTRKRVTEVLVCTCGAIKTITY